MQKSKIISRLATKFIVADGDVSVACSSRKNVPPLAVGDWVEWQTTGKGEGVIEALVPRHNMLARPNPLTQFEKPVAANIDVMVVVVATEPSPDLSLVDEYLVLARLHKIAVLIVHNKQDLPAFETTFKGLQEYQTLGYDVLACSSATGQNMSALKETLADKTCVFLGQSGVGKSSLINALLPESQRLRTQALSDKSEGKHTTSHSTLYPLDNGAEIIDSPGIREFGLWKLDGLDIEAGFVEIAALAPDCKFHNCKHLKEPKCAVKDAVALGDISKRRYESYCALLTATTVK